MQAPLTGALRATLGCVFASQDSPDFAQKFFSGKWLSEKVIGPDAGKSRFRFMEAAGDQNSQSGINSKTVTYKALHRDRSTLIVRDQKIWFDAFRLQRSQGLGALIERTHGESGGLQQCGVQLRQILVVIDHVNERWH